ncbi:hypothetical protein WJX81_005143 [Elliptochloris bilobata]|uniref:DUF3618 domain-containing protein n=1 Tax=Elliptochloris bilobata TaxID=381761 RepID=A0AAW1SDU2_9CHLO
MGSEIVPGTGAHANGGAPPTLAKSGGKAPAPLPEAVKEQAAEREARETEALQRELARVEAALAALRTEHEDLAAAREQLIRSVHRLEEEAAQEREAADAARAGCISARRAAFGLGATTALSLIALGVVAARCSRRTA